MRLCMRQISVLVALAAVVSYTLSGCSAPGGASVESGRDKATAENTASGSIERFAFKLGDCKMSSGQGLVSDADVVPCDEPHDEEVFFEYKMPDGEFSEEAIDAASQEQCTGDAFTEFVGLAFNDSVLEVYPLTPTEQTWNEYNDRVIQCIISDPAGQVSTSLKGAAR